LIDLQNSFTGAKSSKFPTKLILGYPPHLKYVALENLKIRNLQFSCKSRKSRFKCEFLSSIQQIKNCQMSLK